MTVLGCERVTHQRERFQQSTIIFASEPKDLTA